MVAWFNVDFLGGQGYFWILPAAPHSHPEPACLPAGFVTTFPYIHVNHRAGTQLGNHLLVIRSNWEIQTPGFS